MEFDYKMLKPYLKNVYFINGTAYAGKSTACKMLAERHAMILCGENYQYDKFLSMTTPDTHPHMNYFKTMKDWNEFIMRSKEAYEAWMDGVSMETTPFEILELISLSREQKVIVDTNIPHDILKEISDSEHVVYMVATPKMATEAFFDRMDVEKRFLYDLIQQTTDPKATMAHYKETIAYLNRQERIDHFKKSGYLVIERQSLGESIEDKVERIERHFRFV